MFRERADAGERLAEMLHHHRDLHPLLLQQVARYGLSSAQVGQSTQNAIDKVSRRVEQFRGGRPFPELAGRIVIIVDDGLAAGSTMRVAISALHRLAVEQVIVAVPTGHDQSVHLIAGLATKVYCANIRSGLSFAVADAYQRWRDIEEQEVMEILARYGPGSGSTCGSGDSG